jgi:hypothetical protein
VVLTGLAELGTEIGSPGVRAQASDDLGALQDRVRDLREHGKYAEAIPLAERYVTVARLPYGVPQPRRVVG